MTNSFISNYNIVYCGVTGNTHCRGALPSFNLEMSIMGDLLDAAIKLAVDAHRGQTDRIGKPVIFHPLQVMMAIPVPKNCSPIDKDMLLATAVLHDVFEDTDFNVADAVTYLYKKSGFPYWAVNKVVNDATILAREEGEGYMEYIARIKDAGGNLVTIKIVDILDNQHREDVPEKKESLAARYNHALDILTS